jgi:hypothetical protein
VRFEIIVPVVGRVALDGYLLLIVGVDQECVGVYTAGNLAEIQIGFIVVDREKLFLVKHPIFLTVSRP